MADTEILLLRHGATSWNQQGRWQGHGDPPLAEHGRAQVAEAARRLRGERIDALVSSDLRRAVETARLVGGVLGLRPVLDPGWRELSIGSWTGLTAEEIRERWPLEYQRFVSGDPDARADGGETRRELTQRARAAAQALAAVHPGRRVLVVTHEGVIRALAQPDRVEHGCVYGLRVKPVALASDTAR